MDGFELYFNIITLFAGGYLLYTWFKLRQTGHLFANQLLVPKDIDPSHCLDEEGYIAYISPRILISGLICAVVGVICTADSVLDFSNKYFSQIPNLEYWIAQGGNLLCLIAIVWYMICWSKARKRYW